jgi:hypothetical protein
MIFIIMSLFCFRKTFLLYSSNFIVAITKLHASRSQKIIQRCNTNSGAQASEDSLELAASRS